MGQGRPRFRFGTEGVGPEAATIVGLSRIKDYLLDNLFLFMLSEVKG